MVWDIFMHIASACIERSTSSFHCFMLVLPFIKMLGCWKRTKLVPLCFWKVGDVGSWGKGGEEGVWIPDGGGSELQTQDTSAQRGFSRAEKNRSREEDWVLYPKNIVDFCIDRMIEFCAEHKKAGGLLDPDSPHWAFNSRCHFASMYGREGVAEGARLLRQAPQCSRVSPSPLVLVLL